MEGEIEAPAEVVEQNLAGATSRSGVQSVIETNPGSWGSWQAMRYCPEGSFAVGYRMRVEPARGSDIDDSALNAVELVCMNDQGTLSRVSAHDGIWGAWNQDAFCANGGFVTGANMRFESSRGSGDDTGGNDVIARCSTGADIHAPGGTTFGAWQGMKTCPVNTSVCGISVRFESSRGSDDDSAMNAARLACCTNPAPRSKLRITEYTLDGIRARTFSPDAGSYQAPLLMVEGFDQDNTMTIDKMLSELPPDFIGALTGIGYSVTIVDLTANWDDIKLNGRRLGALAEKLWTDSARVRPIKFVGASMGGLVVTTAAAIRENPGALGESAQPWTFKVDHVTTIDSPHSGVYIPQGIYHFISRFNNWNDDAKTLLGAITSTATKQMLMIPYNSAFETVRNDWQGYYAKVLTVMRRSDIRFVAVSNGSWTGAVQYADGNTSLQNLYWQRESLDYNAWAKLFTQPAAGKQVAAINLDLAGPQYESKSYNAVAGPIVENGPGGYTTFWKSLADKIPRNHSGPGSFTTVTLKFERHAFVPSWSAVGISMTEYGKLPDSLKANMSALEASKGRLAGSSLSPFDRIIAGPANTRHVFGISANELKVPFIQELAWAFSPPAYKPAWTGWFNTDQVLGDGDNEPNKASCQQPLVAECRRVSDGVDWTRTGEVVTCTPTGLVCLNSAQPDGQCDDYQVRFACPNGSDYTPWLDRDDAGGNGDGEHHGIFVQEGRACAAPISIECATTSGIPWSSTGEKVVCTPNRGAICLNAEQSDLWCEDYQVRFACPVGGSWTAWLNRDNAGGNGDGEHLGIFVGENKVCPRPLAVQCSRVSDGRDWTETGEKMVCNTTQGAICLNADQADGGCDDYQVRFFCGGAWPAP
jgi:hypothetical protein